MSVFVESQVFDRVGALYLGDEEYSELQSFMMQGPEARAMKAFRNG
ncbi:MAG: hypothetical protein K2X03_03720 [Bryobacteraceae bacterium]|nr:hypothetical protein [Bryobacteraceae bacterium]